MPGETAGASGASKATCNCCAGLFAVSCDAPGASLRAGLYLPVCLLHAGRMLHMPVLTVALQEPASVC
jgi:hypothetical protein